MQKPKKTQKRPADTPSEAPQTKRQSTDKQSSTAERPPLEKSANGEELIPLGGSKYVTVGEYKGTMLVNIRQYYADRRDEGKLKPGKAGIAMDVGTYNTLKDSFGTIDALLAEKMGTTGDDTSGKKSKTPSKAAPKASAKPAPKPAAKVPSKAEPESEPEDNEPEDNYQAGGGADGEDDSGNES